MRASSIRVAALAAIAAAMPADALAYIDPGTGSMLLQSLFAAVAAGLVFGRTLWYKIKSVFGRNKGKDSEPKG
jgi:hypothetical protein